MEYGEARGIYVSNMARPYGEFQMVPVPGRYDNDPCSSHRHTPNHGCHYNYERLDWEQFSIGRTYVVVGLSIRESTQFAGRSTEEEGFRSDDQATGGKGNSSYEFSKTQGTSASFLPCRQRVYRISHLDQSTQPKTTDSTGFCRPGSKPTGPIVTDWRGDLPESRLRKAEAIGLAG